MQAVALVHVPGGVLQVAHWQQDVIDHHRRIQPRDVERVAGDHRVGEMADRLHQPLHAERSDVCHRSYETSTIISISTEMPSGSELMPTAERAWRPASPNATTSRSDAPLMTFG